MRTRFATIGLAALAVLILGVGAVGASSGYRRMAANETRVVRLQTELQERAALILGLTGEVAELKTQLGSGRLRAAAVAAEAERARRQLRATQEELLRLEEQVAAQRQDVEVLGSCLSGTLYALQSMAGGDRFGALQHLMAVDGACRRAYRLLGVQATTN